MEAEQVLQLMDFCWFQRRIFNSKHELPSHSKTEEIEATDSRAQNLQIRSYSDRCIAVGLEADSPRSVIVKPKLQRIPSGEEAAAAAAESNISIAGREKREKARVKRRRERGRSWMSRSLSALEFEELKGFMDLGFVFNEEETNPDLTSIIPGLQKRGKTAVSAADGGGEVGIIARPYLSEAWGDLDRRRGDRNALMKWRIPNVKNEIDMKDHIKIWAHFVASTVR